MSIEGIASHHGLNALVFTQKTKEQEQLVVCVLAYLNQVILSSSIGEMISSPNMDFPGDPGFY